MHGTTAVLIQHFRYLFPLAKGVALELGCGNGISTLAISKEGKYTHTYGVDISPEAIKRCKGLSSKSDDITFIHGDALGEEESITSLYGKCDAVFDSQFFHAGIMPYCIIIT